VRGSQENNIVPGFATNGPCGTMSNILKSIFSKKPGKSSPFIMPKSPGVKYFHDLFVFLILAFASAMFGCFNGFVFGIPKTIRNNGTAAPGATAGQGGYTANTNLEDISDWITKIIVALGIVELMKLPGLFRRLADYIQQEASMKDVSDSTLISIILYFGIAGFFFGYLFTRFYLPREWGNWEDKDKNAEIALEGAINGNLYRPCKLDDVFNLIEEYEGRFTDANPRVNMYKACALGQKYGALTETDKAKSQFPLQALEAMKKTVATDGGYANLLYTLWNKNRLSASDTQDDQNDLFPFYDLPSFQQFFQDLGLMKTAVNPLTADSPESVNTTSNSADTVNDSGQP
jgi:hypothetical protein